MNQGILHFINLNLPYFEEFGFLIVKQADFQLIARIHFLLPDLLFST